MSLEAGGEKECRNADGSVAQSGRIAKERRTAQRHVIRASGITIERLVTIGGIIAGATLLQRLRTSRGITRPGFVGVERLISRSGVIARGRVIEERAPLLVKKISQLSAWLGFLPRAQVQRGTEQR